MKKIIATLLAVMMLAVSFGAVAEDHTQAAINAGRRVTSVVTLSDVATDFSGDPAVDQVVADVLNAITLTAYTQGDEVYYAVGMKQDSGAVADMLTLGVLTQGTDVYLMSNIIGGTIVVGENELLPLIERLLDVFVQMGFFDQETADGLKAELPAILEMATAEATASMQAAKALENIDIMALNYDAINGLLATVAGKIVVGEPAVLPRNCDPAVAMYTCTLTPEEMNAISTAMLQFIKDNPDLAQAIAVYMDFDNTIAPSLAGVVEGKVDFIGFIDMMMTEMANAKSFGGDVSYYIWVGEDGMPVAMDMVAPIQNEDEVITMAANYTRLTLNDGVAHSLVMGMPGVDMTVNVVLKGAQVTVTLDMAENGQNVMSIKADYTDRSAENVQAFDLVIDVVAENVTVDDGYGNVTAGETLNMTFDCSSDTTFNGVDFTQKDAVTVIINGKTYFTVNVDTQTAEAGASIADGNVVRPAALNDNEFVNWFVQAYSALFSWLQNAMYALPSSVINLMNTGY